jgi:uncharacterized protein (TIGR03435 family)
MKRLLAPLLVIVCLSVELGATPRSRPLQSRLPSFEVATIKPGTPGDTSGKFATMQSTRQFAVRNYTVKDLVSFAYDMPLKLISGGPSWADLDKFNILAATPGETRPSLEEQMAMMRALLADRFKLELHTEPKEMAAYALIIAKDGIKVRESAKQDGQPSLVTVLYPGVKAVLPARNSTMGEVASMLQRGVVDRPVVNKTNLSAKYDFDLEWTYDDTLFGGKVPPVVSPDPNRPDLFTAFQQQLGLKLESARERVNGIVIDRVAKPSEN